MITKKSPNGPCSRTWPDLPGGGAAVEYAAPHGDGQIAVLNGLLVVLVQRFAHIVVEGCPCEKKGK